MNQIHLVDIIERITRKFGKIFDRRIIDGITLFTNSQCNLICIYCCTKDRRKKMCCIKLNEWEDVILQAKTLGARWVIFGGPGEPLMDDMNLKLIEYAYTLGIRNILFTNGTFVSQEIADFLYTNEVFITLKVHSFNPEIYDFLSGRRNSTRWVDYEYMYKQERLKHAIPLSLKLLLERNNKENLRKKTRFLRIESVITKYNLECLVNLAKFIQAHNLDFIFETLISTFDKEIDNLIPTNEEYRYIFKRLRKCLGRKFVWAQRSRCCVRDNPVIWESGDMAFCGIQGANIGNIQNNTLEELWLRRLCRKDKKIKNKSIYGFRDCSGREYCSAFNKISLQPK